VKTSESEWEGEGGGGDGDGDEREGCFDKRLSFEPPRSFSCWLRDSLESGLGAEAVAAAEGGDLEEVVLVTEEEEEEEEEEAGFDLEAAVAMLG
jgi:hypothetical protein